MTTKKKTSKKATAEAKRKKRRYVRFLWLLVLSPIIGISLLLLAASLSDLPTFEALENPKNELASEILTDDKELLGKYYIQNRTNVEYENLNAHLIDALVSTEDERFFEHSGVDFRGLVRAIAYMGKRGGASTLTQQLAKQLFSERPRNIFERVFQKTQEWIIATRLEKSYTKEEILTMYFNQYDFLNSAIGIKSAANIYFSKEPKELNLQESAMLVGMFKNSSLYNPLKNEEGVTNRREVVLSQMKRNGHVEQPLYDSLRVTKLGLRHTKQDHIEGLAPYFREILRAELTQILKSKNKDDEYKYINPNTDKPYDLYRDGLKIYTTIDSRLQAHAEHGVRTHLGQRLQKDFDRFTSRSLNNPPFANDVEKSDIKRILNNAKKRSRLYRVLTGVLCGRCERTKTLDTETIEGTEMYVCTHSTCSNKFPVRDDKEIEKIFNTKKEMTVYSWSGPIDTLMTPMDSIRYYKGFLQAGLMSMDPATGFIKAWVGGIDYKEFKFDHVRQGKRQVGSTFKPIIYATAMREGYSPCFEIPKVPTTFRAGTFNLTEDWTPEDSDKDYGYMATLNWGLSNSVNTMTAWVMKQFGPDAVVKLARDMGIESDLLPVPSLCLGVADLSVYEITAANAVFANQGVYVEPIMITRIEDKFGNSIFDVIPETREALDARTAAIMIEMMKGTADGVFNKHREKSSGTAMRLRMDLGSRKYDGFSKDLAIACKTGTTQNQSDGWFIGMTPDLATGVWVGAEDRGVRFADLSLGMGTNMALPIWGHYMKKAYADESLGLENKDFDYGGINVSEEIDCTQTGEDEHNQFNEAPDDEFD